MEQIKWFEETPAEDTKKFLDKMAKKYNDKLANGELFFDDDWKVLAEIERQQLQHEILMKIIFGDSD